jgi:hypothetical protein
MRAIVCDCCGKTELLCEETNPFSEPMHTYHLISPKGKTKLDLCEECAENLVKATRKEETL